MKACFELDLLLAFDLPLNELLLLDRFSFLFKLLCKLTVLFFGDDPDPEPVLEVGEACFGQGGFVVALGLALVDERLLPDTVDALISRAAGYAFIYSLQFSLLTFSARTLQMPWQAPSSGLRLCPCPARLFSLRSVYRQKSLFSSAVCRRRQHCCSHAPV